MKALYLSKTGRMVPAHDPDREIWYGPCGYWTDNWHEVAKGHIIPCCPICQAPGYQTSAKEWFAGAYDFEAKGAWGYIDFLRGHKETCFGRGGLMGAWKKFLAEAAKEED